MKRYKLTSDKFKGAVEVIYNMEGVLHKIDFSTALVTPQQISYFKSTISVKADNIYEAFGAAPVMVEEAEFEVTFADFKREYPRKRNMHLAEKHWTKLTSGKQYLAFMAAADYKKHCDRKALKQEFIMLPERFLKEEHWKNDWKNEGL